MRTSLVRLVRGLAITLLATASTACAVAPESEAVEGTDATSSALTCTTCDGYEPSVPKPITPRPDFVVLDTYSLRLEGIFWAMKVKIRNAGTAGGYPNHVSYVTGYDSSSTPVYKSGTFVNIYLAPGETKEVELALAQQEHETFFLGLWGCEANYDLECVSGAADLSRLWVGVTVDALGKVQESNEGNNYRRINLL